MPPLLSSISGGTETPTPPCDRDMSQMLPRLDRQREDEEDDNILMDESKPPANSSNDGVA